MSTTALQAMSVFSCQKTICSITYPLKPLYPHKQALILSADFEAHLLSPYSFQARAKACANASTAPFCGTFSASNPKPSPHQSIKCLSQQSNKRWMFSAHFKNDLNALTDQTSATTKVKNEKKSRMKQKNWTAIKKKTWIPVQRGNKGTQSRKRGCYSVDLYLKQLPCCCV
jgi:hypothetical protein